MNRFAAPRNHINSTRFKAVGLGGDTTEVVPYAGEPEDEEVDVGFTGIRSRTRFTPPRGQVTTGHGSLQGGAVNAAPLGRDPGEGRTQFDKHATPLSMSERNTRDTTSDLGADDRELTRGFLSYIRRWVDVPTGGTRIADLPRWSDAGPIPQARRQLRYTLRPEFGQNAQSFLGQHTSFVKKTHYSTSPVRMLPPRSSRLARRDQPASFGAETTVLNA